MYLRVILSAIALSMAASGQSVVGANAPDAYQVKVFANSGIADSFIDISNAGNLPGVGLSAGTTASIGGSICANVYVFAADEQLMECCSCGVTPNGSVELSVQRDLVPNVIEPQLPINGLAVALMATKPLNGSCTGSAYQTAGSGIGTFPEDSGGVSPVLASGMVAWATTVHANTSTTPASFRISETPFEPKVLLDAEATKMTLLCNFLQANGGGPGLCHGCTVGALGAAKQ